MSFDNCEKIALRENEDKNGHQHLMKCKDFSHCRQNVNNKLTKHSEALFPGIAVVEARQRLAELRMGGTSNGTMPPQHPKQTPNGAGTKLVMIDQHPTDMKMLNSALIHCPLSSFESQQSQKEMAMFIQQKRQTKTTSACSKETTNVPSGKRMSAGVAWHKDNAVKRSFPADWHSQHNGQSLRTTANHQLPVHPTQTKSRIQLTPKHGTQLNSQIDTAASNGTSPEDLSIFCNTYVEARDKQTCIIDEECIGQFQCSFQNCAKRLKNNVTFMYHIWAHIAQQKPTKDDRRINLQILLAEHTGGNCAGDDIFTAKDQRSDVSRLHTCPECLLEQPTLYRARLHYHRVHKRGKRPLLETKRNKLIVCNICEQVFDTTSMQQHAVSHCLPNTRQQLDLPYECRFTGSGKKCLFRVSNRSALLQHFCNEHDDTHVLLCPFCLLTFSVPSADRRKRLIRMREYILHMTLHHEEKSRHCAHCVVRFGFSQLSQMEQHQEQHSKGGDRKWLQWRHKRFDLNSIQLDKSCAFTCSDMPDALVKFSNDDSQQKKKWNRMMEAKGTADVGCGKGAEEMQEDSQHVVAGDDEMHEAKLFGLLCMADVPRREVNEEEEEQKLHRADSADEGEKQKGERGREELRKWLSEFMMLREATELSQRVLQPNQTRLLERLMNQDEHRERIQLVCEEELREMRINASLMFYSLDDRL
uniref:C2H2-type domain-containing protein n=1 Tax=Globodera rostochiensis TaxID=31243 RepID=A0A914HJ08_GLORO